MQIQSNCGNLVIDYYPAKSWLTNNLIPDLNLKVVTTYGKTMYKVLMNDYATGNDIIKKYKFWGNKVFQVLGVPENYWIYSDKFVLSNTGSANSV